MSQTNRYLSLRNLLILFTASLLLVATNTTHAYDEGAEDIGSVQPLVTTADPITFVIPIAADTEVNTHDKDKNHGAVDDVKVLADDDHIHRPLFRYDLASVLPGSTISSATVYFYVSEKDSNPVNIHRVSTRWEEDIVTWDSFNEGFFPASSGSFIPYPYNKVHGASITALVEDWITGAERNRGLVLIPSVEKKDSKYATKEHNKLERHSYLEVIVDNAAIRTYADDFGPSTAYTGSDGSELWSSAWQEIGENNGTSLGMVQVVEEVKCPSIPCLKIGEENGSLTGVGIRRQVDLGGAVAATLSFSYQREDAKGLLHVEVSGDGGSNWHRLDSITLEHDDGGHNYKSYDISSHIAAATQIRVVGEQSGGSNDKGVFIDDVRVAYLDNSALESGIGDVVWDDSNRDGVQDGSENGIADVRIDLYTGKCGNADGPPYRSTDTNASGEYSFANLFAGDYCLVVDGSSLPADYVSTSYGSPLSVHLNTSEVVTNADFGYASAYAEDRLTVGAHAPCSDITWLQQHATNNNATFLTEDYKTCNFTLGVSSADMAGLAVDVANDLNTRHVGPDVFTAGAQDFPPDPPNDPFYNNPSFVYGPQQINALTAWTVTTGDPNLTVAVLDTGVDLTHPEYSDRLLPGWDFVNDDADPSDDQGHGTHISGIIASGINNGIGIAGIAGNVKILPVKVLGANGSGWWSDVADGVTWAVDQGARVLNLSLAGSVDSYVLQDAISYANSRGAIVVVAAGNDSTNALQYPASYSDVLSSGATTYMGERWSLSNYGPNVDVVAPGSLIYATQMGGDYRFMSGTSMAAPHVAGLAALLLSQDPNLAPSEITDIILGTAVDMGDRELHGVGLIDAGAAVTSVNSVAYSPPVTSMKAQLVNDISANGIIDPGDTVRYIITIANGNAYPLNNVIVSASVPDNATYAAGMARLNGIQMHDDSVGTRFPLDEGGFGIVMIPANDTMAVSFDVIVSQPLPAFHELYAEAMIDDDSGVKMVDAMTPVGGDTCSLALRNDAGAIVDSLRIGKHLHLSLLDSDENSHAGTVQSVTVSVVNPSTGDSESVTMIESGVDSGIFEGDIQLSKVLGQIINDGILNASTDNQIVSVSYIDTDFTPDQCVGAITTLSPGAADLRVTKTVSDSTPDENQSLVYTIKVKNNGGPNDATSVVIGDNAPAGIDFITGNATHGDFDYENGIWTVGQLPVGVEAVLTIDAEVSGDSGSTINNDAFVQAVDQIDPVSSNDTASVAVTVSPADLQVTKTVNVDDPNEGQTVRYTINVKNHGPAAIATDIVIRDVLPLGMSFVGATAEQGAYDEVLGLWTVGSLADGDNVDLVIDAMYTSGLSGEDIVNRASVHSFGQTDVDSTNDTASVTVTPKTADLRVQKSVDDSGPIENQGIVYTVKVKNQGPATLATDIVVSDVLPDGLSFVSAVEQQGIYSDSTGRWKVGDLPSGMEVSLNIYATVDSGTSGKRITNQAEVVSFDQVDHAPANDSDSQDIIVAPADLRVTKTVNNDTPDEEEGVQYIVTVRNDGPSFATGIVISDVLPSTLTFVSANEDVGAYNPDNGLWTLNTVLPARQSKEMVITAKPKFGTSGQTITNRAEVVSLDQLDDDSRNDFDEIDVEVNGVDIVVSIDVDEDKPGENMQIEYTVGVKNNGPAAIASGIIVDDLLPDELDFISAEPEQGRYDPDTRVWTVGNLNEDQTTELTVIAYVPTGLFGKELSYQAQLLAVDQFETKADNNSETRDIAVSDTDIEVTKTIEDDTLSPGMLAEYTIEVRHNGPADNVATGIVVSDMLPAGMAFDSAIPDQGTYSQDSGLWAIGALEKGQTKRLVISAVVEPMMPAVSSVINTAAFHSMDQQDDSPNNNSDSASFSYEDADIWVDKRVSDSTPDEGDTINFIIEARNLGPATIAGTVRIQDVLPEGLTYVDSLADAGSYDPIAGLWTIPELSEYDGNNQVELIVHASVDAGTNGTTVTNIATTISSQPDPITINNTDSVSIVPGVEDFGSIGDFVWHDQDGNGIQDPIELGIDGVTVELTDEVGDMTTTSTLAGNYEFTNLSAGTYTIRLDPTSLPPEYSVITTPVEYVIDLDPGQNHLDADFGYNSTTSSYTVSKILKGDSPVRLGAEVTFEITVTNTGSTWLAIVPLQDVYNPIYLDFKGSDILPNSVDEVSGILQWEDVTSSPLHDLAPGESTTITVTFEALADTTGDPALAPNGVTVNTARVDGAWADADGPGPLGADISLPIETDEADIQIYNATGITLNSLTAIPEHQSVSLSWQTHCEIQLLGFNIKRSMNDDNFEFVNSAPLPAAFAGADQGASYAYVDTMVQPGTMYQYVLEAVQSDGSTEWFKLAPVTANWSVSLPLVVDN